MSPSRYEQDEPIPEPLERRGVLRFALWGLPAGALSLASAASLVVTVAVLQLQPRLRDLFVLPLYVSLAAALVASLVSWCVVRAGRSRPGRLAPRLWALTLALVASLTLPWLIFDSTRPLAHAVAVGTCAAALVLLPRGLRLGPQSALVPWIAPASLVTVLGVVVPAAVHTGELAVRVHDTGLEAHLARLRDATVALREVSETDFERLADEPALAQAQLDRLRGLTLPPLDDPAVWHSAAGLGRTDTLLEASQALVSATATALAKRHRPGLSRLKDMVEMRWDPGTRGWVDDRRFAPASRFIAQYHDLLSQRFLALEPRPATTELGTLHAHYEAQRAQAAAELERDWRSWSDRWVLFGLPPNLVEPRESSLARVLRLPLAHEDGEGVEPADLRRLLRWPLHRARSLVRSEPSCHAQSYEESGEAFYRLDCHAYTPHPGDRRATLLVELRLVYRGRYGWLQDSMRPVEVFYLFPVPEGSTAESYRRDVATGLRDAVAAVAGREVFGAGRGTPWSGFALRDGGLIKVYSAQIRSTLPDRLAIEVRSELEGV